MKNQVVTVTIILPVTLLLLWYVGVLGFIWNILVSIIGSLLMNLLLPLALIGIIGFGIWHQFIRNKAI